MMKILLSFLFVLLHLIGFGQAKNCNSVNVPGKSCVVQIIRENNDTIICLIEDDCYHIEYDLNKDATWISYSKDTSKILEIISFNDGKQTKTHTQYFDNGKLKCQSKYENGELIGPYIRFFEGGEIEWAGMYIEGRFIGAIYKYSFINYFITNRLCET